MAAGLRESRMAVLISPADSVLGRATDDGGLAMAANGGVLEGDADAGIEFPVDGGLERAAHGSVNFPACHSGSRRP